MAIDPEDKRLPVYDKTRQLYKQLRRSTQKVPVIVSRGPVAETESLLIGMLDSLSFAEFSSNTARMDYIQEAQKILNRVKIRVRTLYDLGYIHKKGYLALVRYENSAAKQLSLWARKTLGQKEDIG
jgi:hypothetical protein